MREMANVLQKYKNKSVTPNADEDAEHQELSLMVGGMQNGAATLETLWQLLRTLTLTRLSSIMLLGIYPDKLKT